MIVGEEEGEGVVILNMIVLSIEICYNISDGGDCDDNYLGGC